MQYWARAGAAAPPTNRLSITQAPDEEESYTVRALAQLLHPSSKHAACMASAQCSLLGSMQCAGGGHVQPPSGRI